MLNGFLGDIHNFLGGNHQRPDSPESNDNVQVDDTLPVRQEPIGGVFFPINRRRNLGEEPTQHTCLSMKDTIIIKDCDINVIIDSKLKSVQNVIEQMKMSVKQVIDIPMNILNDVSFLYDGSCKVADSKDYNEYRVSDERKILDSLIRKYGNDVAYQMLLAGEKIKSFNQEQDKIIKKVKREYLNNQKLATHINELKNLYQTICRDNTILDAKINKNEFLSELFYYNETLSEIDKNIEIIENNLDISLCESSSTICASMKEQKQKIIDKIDNIKKNTMLLSFFEKVYENKLLLKYQENNQYTQSNSKVCSCCYVNVQDCILTECGHAFCEDCIKKSLMRRDPYASLLRTDIACFICKKNTQYIRMNSIVSIESMISQCNSALRGAPIKQEKSEKSEMHQGLEYDYGYAEMANRRTDRLSRSYVEIDPEPENSEPVNVKLHELIRDAKKLLEVLQMCDFENDFEYKIIGDEIEMTQTLSDIIAILPDKKRNVPLYDQNHPLYGKVGISTRKDKNGNTIKAKQDDNIQKVNILTMNKNDEIMNLLDGIKSIINKYKSLHDNISIVNLTLNNIHSLANAYNDLSKKSKNECANLGIEIDKIHEEMKNYTQPQDPIKTLQKDIYERLKIEVGILNKFSHETNSTSCNSCQNTDATNFYNPCGHIVCNTCKHDDRCQICFVRNKEVKKLYF